MCACGKPLHYLEPMLREIVQSQVDQLGENIRVRLGTRVWLVPRHFIALHGIRARELERLRFPQVTDDLV